MKRESIGERVRKQRVNVLQKGLREMARALEISAAYLTDIEKDRRVPSDQLLRKICKEYSLDEAELRTAWQRADTVVGEVANQDAVTAEKVPQFLRTARNLKAHEWDEIIKQASLMAKKRRQHRNA
jgi:transcriptional regulator with XRE-family HTH domain